MSEIVPNSLVGQQVVNNATVFTALNDQVCRSVEFLNTTGVSIDVRQVSYGTAQPFQTVINNNPEPYVVEGVSNANEVQVKLTAAGGPVTLKFKQIA